MGTFYGVTASNGARIKEGKVEEVKKLMDKYDFSRGLECMIDNGSIYLLGYEWPDLWLKYEDDDDQDCEDNFEEFLKELAPFLSENLVIHAIGNEKCIFPLAAMEIKVTPHGKIRKNTFRWLS
jgi:hypothetical protein